MFMPDGRVIITEGRQDKARLEFWAPGKEPVPLANTTEETVPPVAVLGSKEVAFRIVSSTPQRHLDIAIADISTGTILRRIVFDKAGIINDMKGTPDGKTLFLSADSSIWSVPSSGGEPRRVRAGNGLGGVDPTGKFLLVEVYEQPKSRLWRVPLDGGAEHEILLTGSYRLAPYTPISPGNITKDGRVLAPLVSPDSSFVSPGIVDLSSGRVTPISVDHHFDYGFMTWGPGGQVTAIATGLKSTLWKFQPEGR
jgi:WD40 repeat protein